MKKKIICLQIILGFIFFFLVQEVHSQLFTAEEPILITSAGQSSDVLMAKILAGKLKLNIVFDKGAESIKVDSVKSIIIVSGGSVKGMGAAGIDKDAEYERVKALIQRAIKKKIPIIGMHVGGKSRRGKMSDYFNQLVAENAQYLIVVKEGNQDEFFSKIAQERKIDVEIVDKILSIQKSLKAIYGKTE